MASYQDIDVRLHVVEDKLNFVMNSFRLGVQGLGDLVPVQKSLLELYYIMIASRGITITDATSTPEVKEGEIIS